MIAAVANLLLEIVEGAGAGTRIPIAGEVELGRDPRLAHPLEDEQVSRHHARISAPAGRALIEDLGSTNGTYVNDQPIAGRHELRPGDRVRVGLTVIELRTEEDATVSGSAVRPVPPVTRIGDGVLEPAAEAELAPVRADQADAPSLMAEESEPAFIRGSAIGEVLGGDDPVTGGAGSDDDPDALARLVDTRVKRQTGVAAFALLAVAALAVAIVLGVR